MHPQLWMKIPSSVTLHYLSRSGLILQLLMVTPIMQQIR